MQFRFYVSSRIALFCLLAVLFLNCKQLVGASYMDIHNAGGGIHFTVEHTRQESEQSLYLLLEERLRRMLHAGTTLVEIKTGYGLDLQTEVKMLQVIERARRSFPMDISSTYCGAHAVPRYVSGKLLLLSFVNFFLLTILTTSWYMHTLHIIDRRTTVLDPVIALITEDYQIHFNLMIVLWSWWNFIDTKSIWQGSCPCVPPVTVLGWGDTVYLTNATIFKKCHVKTTSECRNATWRDPIWSSSTLYIKQYCFV